MYCYFLVKRQSSYWSSGERFTRRRGDRGGGWIDRKGTQRGEAVRLKAVRSKGRMQVMENLLHGGGDQRKL